ncbi:MAG: bifunctional oligoribonuclease/PAP phosphatase NrnA [Bacteroidales bacterium]|nr:bifunctional oligoribonuclease/PAP phosphatase NrnA [Bacteroidales bacterium]
MSNIIKYSKELKLFESKIKDAENIIIVPHYNPDGDAIGSALALCLVLRNAGKNASVISPTQYPSFLFWMPGRKYLTSLGKKTESNPDIFKDADMLIGVDFNALNRIKNVSDRFNNSDAYKILIDHHPNPEDFTDLLFSETSYCSTAGLLFEIIENTYLKQYLDKDIASCLYTGIMTDTGSFSFNSSNPNTFRIVSELLKLGIEKDIIYDRVYNSFTMDRMRFMGHVMLNRMVIIPELKTGYIYITAQDRKDFKEKFGDTENFVNFPLSVKGIIFAAIFIQRDNFVKISLRSKGSFSVNEFSAKYFNGGGHINAAGGESFGSLQETIEKFVESLQDYKSILKNYNY